MNQNEESKILFLSEEMEDYKPKQLISLTDGKIIKATNFLEEENSLDD